jgi:hypothetical protein
MKTLILSMMTVASLTVASVSYSAFAYVSNTRSDVRILSHSEIDTSEISEAATEDAQEYFNTHNSQKWYDGIANVGLSHAMKGGYKGDAAYLYMEYFDVAYRALYKDQ